MACSARLLPSAINSSRRRISAAVSGALASGRRRRLVRAERASSTCFSRISDSSSWAAAAFISSRRRRTASASARRSSISPMAANDASSPAWPYIACRGTRRNCWRNWVIWASSCASLLSISARPIRRVAIAFSSWETDTFDLRCRRFWGCWGGYTPTLTLPLRGRE